MIAMMMIKNSFKCFFFLGYLGVNAQSIIRITFLKIRYDMIVRFPLDIFSYDFEIASEILFIKKSKNIFIIKIKIIRSHR